MFWVFESDWRLWEPGHEPAAVKERLARNFAIDELEPDGSKKGKDEPTAVDEHKKVTCREVCDTCFLSCQKKAPTCSARGCWNAGGTS